MYAQTILGFSWAILQPLIQIVIFTIVFGKVARLSTDGIPYFLFSSVAIIPLDLHVTGHAAIQPKPYRRGRHLLAKVYFPRLLFPLTPVLARLVDFGISLFIIIAVALYYHVIPTWNIAVSAAFCCFNGIDPGGHWHVVIGPRYPVPGRKTCHAVCCPHVNLYGPHCLFCFINTRNVSLYLFIESHCGSHRGVQILSAWHTHTLAVYLARHLNSLGPFDFSVETLYFKRMEWLFVDVI